MPEFRRFWDMVIALHGILPTGSGRIAHILGCMVFKEPARTQKNLLSQSCSSKLSYVRLQPGWWPALFFLRAPSVSHL